jgi:sugar phosphate isomerase/epimerase
MSIGERHHVLWAIGASHLNFDQRLEAAQAAGCDTITITYDGLQRELSTGRTPTDLCRRAAGSGVRIGFLDGLTDWSPQRMSPALNPLLQALFDYSCDQALAICEAMEIDAIVAVGAYAHGAVDHNELVDGFGAFCERAAGAGVRIDLEFVPMLGLRTLREAWAVVRDTASGNATVVLDTWNFMRGERDFDLLTELPPGTIRNVQVADGRIEPTTDDLWDDAFHGRLLPGEGEFPIERMFGLLAESQDIDHIGPEPIFDGLDRLSPREFGRRCADSMTAGYLWGAAGRAQ